MSYGITVPENKRIAKQRVLYYWKPDYQRIIFMTYFVFVIYLNYMVARKFQTSYRNSASVLKMSPSWSNFETPVNRTKKENELIYFRNSILQSQAVAKPCTCCFCHVSPKYLLQDAQKDVSFRRKLLHTDTTEAVRWAAQYLGFPSTHITTSLNL